MSDFILFDPLFRVPLITGLILTVSLSLIGGYLKMRDEWLSALGLSQIAAAGAVLGVALGMPVMLTAFLAAGAASLLKDLNPKSGNSNYALMIILGWSASLMLAANTYHGEVAGESFLRGQLYFVHSGHMIASIILLAVILLIIKWLSPRLLTERFFPDYYSANNLPAALHRAAFAIITVSAVVLGTVSFGAFPAFGIFFVPSWVGFVIADGWRRSLILSVIIGVAAYLITFSVALLGDQPFGPLFLVILVFLSLLRPLSTIIRKQ